jgi:hypothetical protein
MKGQIRERSPGHWAFILDQRDSATGKRKRKLFPNKKAEDAFRIGVDGRQMKPLSLNTLLRHSDRQEWQ